MDATLHQDEIFENINFSENKLTGTEYADCEFTSCNFSGTDLSHIDFMDCEFKNCNFSLAVLNDTRVKTLRFRDCKLMGLDFSKCNDFLFAAYFENCQMDYCSFFQKKMKKTAFIGCSLKDVDFAEADLTMALFKNCDLLHATFMGTILEKADFRTAMNYSFDPELNRVNKAKFSYTGIAGLLGKYNIDIE